MPRKTVYIFSSSASDVSPYSQVTFALNEAPAISAFLLELDVVFPFGVPVLELNVFVSMG